MLKLNDPIYNEFSRQYVYEDGRVLNDFDYADLVKKQKFINEMEKFDSKAKLEAEAVKCDLYFSKLAYIDYKKEIKST